MTGRELHNAEFPKTLYSATLRPDSVGISAQSPTVPVWLQSLEAYILDPAISTMDEARKFIAARTSSSRKMSPRQCAHICKMLVDNFDRPAKEMYDKLDQNIIKGVQRGTIDGKLQNERNVLNQALGKGKNGIEKPKFDLDQVRQAWAESEATFLSSGEPMTISSAAPTSNSKEFDMFLARIEQAGGAEKAAKFESASKHGGFARTKAPAEREVHSTDAPQSCLLTQQPEMSQPASSQSSLTMASQSQSVESPLAAPFVPSLTDLAMFQQFKAFLAMSGSSTPTIGSTPASPIKSDSRDSSPTPMRPAKMVKIGESALSSADHILPALYDPDSPATFVLREYATVVSQDARGYVLLMDQSAQEVVITLGCPWWCQISASLDSVNLPGVNVNVVPDDAGLYAVLSQIDPSLITPQAWKLKVTRSDFVVPVDPLSFIIRVPSKVFNRRGIRIVESTHQQMRIVRISLPFLG